MTLCLAWFNPQNISIASDSRLTNGDGSVVTNNANKIFTINVNAINKAESNKIVFNSKYGLCFTGSYLNGSILSDTISELTSNIELYNNESISFETISKLSFILYEYISRHLMEINNENGLSEVLLVGYCPKEKTNKIVKFFSKINEQNEIEFIQESLEVKSGSIIYIGDKKAIEKAKALEQKIKYPYTEFHLIKEIIEDLTINSVGGCIQYGCIVANTFRTYGIVDYEIYQPKTSSEPYRIIEYFQFRSIPFSSENSKLNEIRVMLNKVFMNPFSDKKSVLEKEILELNIKKFSQ
jgi:hypothetical protein